MATIQRHCDTHPDRQAIGVCVITGAAICAECSTRYEGVNYSKRGLELLQAQRAQERQRAGPGERALRVLSVVTIPVLLLALYAFFHVVLVLLVNVSQLEVG